MTLRLSTRLFQRGRLTGIALTLALAGVVVPSYADTESNTATPDFRAAMHTWKETYKLPSLSLSVEIDGELVFADAIGFADVDNKKMASVATQYSVGSIAKPMTGIALGKLIDSGNVDLNKSVAEYLTDYPQ